MTLAVDPEYAERIAAISHLLPAQENLPVGDVLGRRRADEALSGLIPDSDIPFDDVSFTEFPVRAFDGSTLVARWHTKAGHDSRSAALHVRGGGMILSSVAAHEPAIRRLVSISGVPLLSLEYRHAPEHPYPDAVEDCYAALIWLANHAADLGIDFQRIGLIGVSAGGGIAAGLALMARDRNGPALAKQILIYPMLDDRTVAPDPELAAVKEWLTWTYEDNATGWRALLGQRIDTPDVPAYAAPARATQLKGLPPTYLEVGEMDIFRDEVVRYAQRLWAAGVSTELHVHPGVPHAWEELAPDINVSVRAYADRCRALRSF